MALYLAMIFVNLVYAACVFALAKLCKWAYVRLRNAENPQP
jgi:hypothetical protein